MSSLRRLGLGGVVILTITLVGATPALATEEGIALNGRAEFTKGGTTIKVPPQARCDVNGAVTATAAKVSKTGVIFGGGTSTCKTTVVDPETETTKTESVSTGKDFELSALVSLKGPRIIIKNYKVNCTGTQAGTNAGFTYSGATGLPTLPSPLPANYVAPLKKSGTSTVLAEATFNEQNLPGDGSIALNMIHIRFKPDSGIDGEVIIGRTACSPTP
ncbi:hypothetical protein SAMN05421504_10684 [Amycolatopsis xylanica]|uniref:Uncharacterized protein n=1 Tax=Amycolatopsis xylanica TaxID=589385 RepID=A0A1H3L5Z7_9PSEU|nr:hypothetical protein [Amycolatopsis xylanica]SDY59957.1 hypothetical protein SAMN05421504_10684 [Amycolatopsis xylanica]